jgi:hypothetical protein
MLLENVLEDIMSVWGWVRLLHCSVSSKLKLVFTPFSCYLTYILPRVNVQEIPLMLI